VPRTGRFVWPRVPTPHKWCQNKRSREKPDPRPGGGGVDKKDPAPDRRRRKPLGSSWSARSVHCPSGTIPWGGGKGGPERTEGLKKGAS